MEKYLIINEENDDVEYILNVIVNHEGTKFVLKRSNSQSWLPHVRGTHALTITDTGNNVIVSPKLDKKVDYNRYTELGIVMNFMRTKESVKMKYKAIQDLGLSL